MFGSNTNGNIGVNNININMNNNNNMNMEMQIDLNNNPNLNNNMSMNPNMTMLNQMNLQQGQSYMMPQDFKCRFGLFKKLPKRKFLKPRIWIQAVSIGEVKVLLNSLSNWSSHSFMK
jgi:3-deoxy-D-manno-octulosonic-acid transferase